MSNRFYIAGVSGNTWYAFIRNADSEIWDGVTFETYSSGSWDDYVVDMVEQVGSGYYSAIFPAGITDPGKYHITIHQVIDSLPANGDYVVGQIEIDWNGTSIEQGVGSVIKNEVLSELSPGIPPSAPTMEQAVMLLYMALKNKRTSTGTEAKIYNNSGIIVTKASQADDGTTFTKEQFGSPS